VANAKYFVFEMAIRDRYKPLRQVNQKPLELERAKKLARIGAERGKHDRAVTNNPRSRTFEIISVYEAGTGENITPAFKANRLVPQVMRRRRLTHLEPPEHGPLFDPETGETRGRVLQTRPELPATPDRRAALRARGWRFDPETGESLLEEPPEPEHVPPPRYDDGPPFSEN
jgi:hypothetical protein